MSRWSGKCDLFDHISGMGGWYDKNGNPVEFGDERVHVYYSDEYNDFLAFKKATDGKMYQHYKVEVTPYNLEMIKENCNGQFEYFEHTKEIKDGRTKSGVREETYYTFKYWGIEYDSFKAINKHGVYITYEIHFNTILDLIKYYPYLVSSCCRSDGKETVVISKESFVDSEFKDHLRFGMSGLKEHYDKELQDHYREICKEYVLKDIEQRTHKLSVTPEKWKKVDDKYEITVPNTIDDTYPVTFSWESEKTYTYWSSPEVKDEHTITIAACDVEYYLAEAIKNNDVSVTYVEKLVRSLSLT